MRDPELDKIAATLHEMAFPTRFAVEVCADCNLACSMCHHPSMRRPKGVMPFELWTKCADEIAAVSPGTQCWFSFCGEPLLEPELLLRMIRYGKTVGLRSLNINTNGMPLIPELAEPVLDSGVDLVVFGIDGFTRETYEKIRVGGDRDRLFANVEHVLAVRRARGEGPEIQVQFIEMDENEHELDGFSSYWLERGAVLKVRKKLSWGGRFETSLSVADEDRIPCPWAITMMHVFWDGRVPRCPGDTEGEDAVGNAWQEPLAVLWERLGVYRRAHLEHRFGDLPDRCRICTDWMTGAASRVRPRERHPRVAGGEAAGSLTLDGNRIRLSANPRPGWIGRMKTLYLCGAGNPEGVRLAIRVNREHGRWEQIFLLDDDPAKHGGTVLGVQVLGPFSMLSAADSSSCEVANLVARTTGRRWSAREKIAAFGVPATTLVDPSVDVSGTEIGRDVLVYQNAVLGPEVVLQEASAVFLSGLVGHESRLGKGSIVGPNAVINARVRLGDGAYVGTNATVLPELEVGAWATVAAGSVAIRNVPAGATVMGVPAKTLILPSDRAKFPGAAPGVSLADVSEQDP